MATACLKVLPRIGKLGERRLRTADGIAHGAIGRGTRSATRHIQAHYQPKINAMKRNYVFKGKFTAKKN